MSIWTTTVIVCGDKQHVEEFKQKYFESRGGSEPKHFNLEAVIRPPGDFCAARMCNVSAERLADIQSWRRSNWGCDSVTVQNKVLVHEPELLSFRFNTEHTPPVKALEALTRLEHDVLQLGYFVCYPSL